MKSLKTILITLIVRAYILYKGKKVSRKKKEKGKIPKGGRVAFSGGITYVPVVIYIYQDDNGTLAATEADVFDLFADMAELYRNNESSIEPYIKSIEISPFTGFYDIASVGEAGLMYLYSRDNSAYNVHIVNNSYTRGAAMMGGTAAHLSVTDGGFNPQTFAHELGHNFNLQHTHDGGLLHEHNGDNNKCDQESVSRTKTNGLGCFDIFQKKCETNGDELCDTPGDPFSNSSVFWGCAGPGGNDKWGDAWQPNLTNLMSGMTDCRSTFSIGQIGVMLDELDTRSFVSQATPNSISGPSQLCLNSTGVYTSSYSSSFINPIWQVPVGWALLSGQGTNTITVRAGPGDGAIFITAYGEAVEPQSTLSLAVTPGSISGPSTVYADGNGRNYYVTPNNGATYFWSVPNGWTIGFGQGNSYISAIPNVGAPSGLINSVVRVCGTAITKYKYVAVLTGGGPIDLPVIERPSDDEITLDELLNIEFAIYPNPVKNDIIIRQKGRDQYKFDVRIIELETGKEALSTSCFEPNTSLNVSKLKPGLYVLMATVGRERITHKFVKE